MLPSVTLGFGLDTGEGEMLSGSCRIFVSLSAAFQVRSCWGLWRVCSREALAYSGHLRPLCPGLALSFLVWRPPMVVAHMNVFADFASEVSLMRLPDFVLCHSYCPHAFVAARTSTHAVRQTVVTLSHLSTQVQFGVQPSYHVRVFMLLARFFFDVSRWLCLLA